MRESPVGASEWERYRVADDLAKPSLKDCLFRVSTWVVGAGSIVVGLQFHRRRSLRMKCRRSPGQGLTLHTTVYESSSFPQLGSMEITPNIPGQSVLPQVLVLYLVDQSSPKIEHA